MGSSVFYAFVLALGRSQLVRRSLRVGIAQFAPLVSLFRHQLQHNRFSLHREAAGGRRSYRYEKQLERS
jgi:hypothetical protein